MTVSRWDVGLVAAFVTAGFGLLLANLVLVAGAVIGLVFSLYGSVSSVPDGVDLTATREFEATGAGPGSEVRVTLRVENTGSTVLPDLRVADGVPDSCPVVDGSARGSKPLRPGERLTIEYTVVLERGRFEFGDPDCRLRSFAGTDLQKRTISAEGDRTLRCGGPLSDPPLMEATLQHTGTVATETGGSGLEFYSTRQYHPGDPMNRINWHQVAKTGEFVTVQYRREQAARTVIIIDCRPCTRVRHSRGYPTGASLAAYAAERMYESLDSAGVITALSAVGLEDSPEPLVGADGVPWVDSNSPDGASTALFRTATRAAADTQGTVGTDGPNARAKTGQTPLRADGGAGPGRGSLTERLVARVPADAQVVLCSPLVDDWPMECASALAARDHACHVISPDVTAGTTTGHRIGAIHRRRRLSALERAGVTVTDWPAEFPVEYALDRTLPQL
ncbi:DUF58 domain-containing protein [Halovenus sp. WSH3]|uniref:DUF58 domain-containing protein n=1 Tax=Halovenus carboxidivorans TaxID=2692199 RepID=A0A6B0T3A5_9EURY|nr:DUF58 domain-containing protein [Halovenus carboxidivorans]MXR52525.1 DUF58 domain-containing protein [Halovenus carboxidivorans]